MKLTNRGREYLTICLLSFIFSYLIITLNYFPHFGMALTLAAFAIFSYKLKRERNKQTKIYFAFTLFFSVMLFVRSEPLITFLNLTATLTFGMLMLTPFQKAELNFFDHVSQPAIFLIKSFLGKSKFYFEFGPGGKGLKSIKYIETIVGVLITIVLLAIILPVLATVNPFFENLVNDFWKLINIENLLENLGHETVFIWLIRLFFFSGFVFMLPKILTFTDKKIDLALPLNIRINNIPLLIPKLAVAATLLVFLITQLQFYFASNITLTGMGISHSERVNEVFGQLTFVAAIVLALIYNSKHKYKLDRFLNWTLGVQGIFLTFMAYKSDFDYINAWGLTYKRLYGLAVATWIIGIFVFLFVNHIKSGKSALFIKNSIIFSAVILMLINVINFDYLIYHSAKATTGSGVDYTYLSRLSSDSLSYKEQYMILEEVSSKDEFPMNYDNQNPLILLNKIEGLQNKYTDIDLRNLSLLEYLQFRQVQSINTKELITRYRYR
jgi:hypothetical protein